MTSRFCFFVLIFFVQVLWSICPAQGWNFIKENNGIEVYTRKEDGRSIRYCKGVAEINAPAEKVFAIIEDVNRTDWWDKNLHLVKVLIYEKNKRARYYLTYDLPWPVADRDLCADVQVTIDSKTGISKITAVPVTDVIKDQTNYIRIRDYKQSWIVKPTGKNTTHIEMESYVDPGGNVPDWIVNMIMLDSPVTLISNLKQLLETKK